MGRHSMIAGRGRGRPGQRGMARPRLVVAAVGAALLVYGLGVATGHATRSTGAPAQPAPPAAAAALPPGGSNGPTHTENGVPLGYSDTQSGAVAAATAYATVLAGPLLARPDQYTAAVETLAAPESRSALTQQASAQLQVLDASYHLRDNAARGVQVVARAIPIAYHVDGYAPGRATVSIWIAGLFAEDGSLAPVVVWATGTYSLEWVASESDWRMTALSGQNGPVPAETQPVSGQTALPPQLGGYTTYASAAG